MSCAFLIPAVSGKEVGYWMKISIDVYKWPNQSILKEISPKYSLEGLMLSWNSNTLATWCKEWTHLKRPWCWERLKAGGEGDNRGWDGWMASLTQWTWVWVNSGSWRWAGRPGVLRFMGSQRVDTIEQLNWTELNTTLNEEMVPLQTFVYLGYAQNVFLFLMLQILKKHVDQNKLCQQF